MRAYCSLRGTFLVFSQSHRRLFHGFSSFSGVSKEKRNFAEALPKSFEQFLYTRFVFSLQAIRSEYPSFRSEVCFAPPPNKKTDNRRSAVQLVFVRPAWATTWRWKSVTDLAVGTGKSLERYADIHHQQIRLFSANCPLNICTFPVLLPVWVSAEWLLWLNMRSSYLLSPI